MPFRRFICEDASAKKWFSFPEWQGFAYTAWAYSFNSDRMIDTTWIFVEEWPHYDTMPNGINLFPNPPASENKWIPNWTLTEYDTLEFRRLARLVKEFREEADIPSNG